MTSTAIAQRVPNELVGSYVYSSQWGGTQLTLKADGSFIEESSNCTSVFTRSGPYYASEQTLKLTAMKLTMGDFGSGKEFDLRKPKARKRFLDTDEPFKPEQSELRIIRWGERIYLMDEERFGSFIDAINLGFEPRKADRYRPFFGAILLREGDEKKEVTGLPPLPAEFVSMLLEAPIIATVLQIETIDGKNIATLDRGSKDGLRENMTLVSDSDDTAFSFQGYSIFSLNEHSAKVVVFNGIKVGDKLSTRVKDVWRYSRLHPVAATTAMAAD